MSVIKGLRAATARSPTIRKAVTVGALAASGGLAAGEDVQSVARKLSAVDRCIEVLSDSMAKLPNFVIDNRSREHVPHDILYLLNVRPNEAMTPAIRKKVLETSRLWRKVMHRLAEEYSDVSYEDVLVDNCAMQLVRDPGQFDVVVTENMFGDILSDEASMVTGSIGLLPSASIGDAAPGLYEPIHGSAPDIAGQDKANPIATILSVAMMFRYSFHLAAEAQAIENAVDAVLAEGWRTADIAEPGVIPIGTREMGRRIREKL